MSRKQPQARKRPRFSDEDLARELDAIQEIRENVGELPAIEIKKGRVPDEDIYTIIFPED